MLFNLVLIGKRGILQSITLQYTGKNGKFVFKIAKLAESSKTFLKKNPILVFFSTVLVLFYNITWFVK